MTTLAAISPLASATNVATGTSVSFTVTSSAAGVGVEILGVSGLNATLKVSGSQFTVADVSKTVTISAAANPANDGTWRIISFIDSSNVEITRDAGSFVAEGPAATFNWVLNLVRPTITALVAGQVALSTQWYADGVLNSTSGTGLTISGVIGLTCVLTTDQSLFEAADVGGTVTITGAVNAVNNGTWTITTFNTSSQVVLTRGAGSFAAETSSFTWQLNNSNIFSSLGSYNFTAQDVGKTITITDSSFVTNNVEAEILSVISSHRVRTNKAGGYSGGGSAEVGLHWIVSGFVNGYTGSITPSSLTNSSYAVTLTPPDHLAGNTNIVVAVTITADTVTPSSYSFTTASRPKIQSANPVVGDPFGRNIRIIFDQPMTNGSELVNAANYQLTAGPQPVAVVPAILTVVPESVPDPTYVDLQLDKPMTNSGQYQVVISANPLLTPPQIFGAAPLSCKLDNYPNNSIQFLGFGTVTQQSVFKDTLVNTPVLVGTQSISFSPTKATFRWNPVGAGGSLLFTASVAGTSGNSLTVWLKDPGSANHPLTGSFSGNNLVVLLATNSAGTVVSRLQDVVTFVVTTTTSMELLASGDLNSIVIPMGTASALSGGAKMDTSATIQIVQNDPDDPTAGSLDPDVVSITLGPQSVGVASISDFVNNGDGSGSFRVVFDSLLTSYKLSIIALDNVDNISNESNVLSVSVLPETIPGIELSIEPYRGVTGVVCDRLIADIPQSLDIVMESFTIPYTYEPFPFTVNVVEIGMPLYITVTQNSISNKPQSQIVTFIPQSLQEIVPLPMGRGRNYIFVTDGIRSAQIVVAATTYGTILCSIANEIYNYSRYQLDEVNLSIFNNLATRLAEPYLALYDVLPAVRPQQLLSTKLAIKSYVSTKGQQQSVEDLVTAMTLQTPVINKTLSEKTYFEPSTMPLFNYQESFAGSDINIWLHNTCATRWVGFVKYLRNFPDSFTLLEADDTEVVFIDDTGTTQRHQFNLLDPACSTLDLGNFCFENVNVDLHTSLETQIQICAASYPHDLCFGPNNPLGPRGLMDTGIPWDSGLPFDNNDYLSEGYLDPGNDGWAGFCVTPHFDNQAPLSAVPPQEHDPILGIVVVDGTTLHGSRTNFTNYVQTGSRVYIRNENVAYTVSTVVSDTELLLSSAPPVNPQQGTAAQLDHPLLSPVLGSNEYEVSGLGTLGAVDLPVSTQVKFFGPAETTGTAVKIPVGNVLDTSTGVSLAALGSTLTVTGLNGTGLTITKTGDTTAELAITTSEITTQHIGKMITIAGATNPTNNGTKLISGFVSSILGVTTIEITDSPLTFFNETSVGATWSVDRFAPTDIGKTVVLSGTTGGLNDGYRQVIGYNSATVLQLSGTLVDEVSSFTWTLLPARGQISVKNPLFRTSDVGKTVKVSGALNAVNNGARVISAVLPLSGVGLSLTGGAATATLVSASPVFDAADALKTIDITSAANAGNIGTWLISTVTDPSMITISRTLGTFTAESGTFSWTFATSSRGLSPHIECEGSLVAADAFLTIACSDVDVTLTVNDTTNYLAAGSLYLDHELITYTGKTLTTFTGCTRGTGGTVAAPHSVSTPATVPFSVELDLDPVVGFVTVAPTVPGTCRISFPDYMPLDTNLFWYVDPRTELKLLSGIPLDSMAEAPQDLVLGHCYILNTTIPPQSVGQPEVPFWVTGVDTNFLESIEVGFSVFFPDDPNMAYRVLAIDGPGRLQIVKSFPENTINPPVITAPHTKVVPVASGNLDASLAVVIGNETLANFTAPSALFTVPSVGRYINFPDKTGFGTSLAGNTLTVPVTVPPTFDAADVGKQVTILGAVNPANNVIRTVTAFTGSTVTFDGAALPGETSNFMWELQDVNPATSKRLGKIVGLVGTAPTNQVIVSSMDGGDWVDAVNNFAWELLPSAVLISKKTDPVCVYQDGFRTTLATLASADVDLSQKSATDDVTLSVTNTEVVTVVPGVSTSTITLAGTAGPAGARPYFLRSEVGYFVALAGSLNVGQYTIVSWISPLSVEVSGVLLADTASQTWTLTNS